MMDNPDKISIILNFRSRRANLVIAMMVIYANSSINVPINVHIANRSSQSNKNQSYSLRQPIFCKILRAAREPLLI